MTFGHFGATPWWRSSVGYEVYLRSFADADGDGVGDLRGLLGRLDHLAWLGVDVVWVTPFYPSPMRDHGYDVADYRDVEPVFGTLADVDALVARCHDLGMRLVIDLVPNHTSSDHEWFRQARSSRDNPYRDYYVWRDPAPDGGPPNNWISNFGGPAWTLDEATGQYWLHLFLPDQPDLNWDNPAVAEEFDGILRFWLERGVDGFRIDVAHALVKHPELLDNPPAAEGLGHALVEDAATLERVHDVDQPGVLDVYRRWRKVVEPYGGLLLGEVYLLDIDRLARYVRHQDGLHLSFWFKPLYLDWDPAAIRDVLEHAAAAAPGHLAWVQSSHDRARAVTRFGGGAVGRARALVFATLLTGLPGVPFVYQGEELGLEDGEIGPEHAQDPVALRGGPNAKSRDGCRTPMPWEPGPGYGFTTARRPWLPFGDRTDADTVAVQRADPDAMLHRYRTLVHLRRSRTDLHDRPVEWLFERGPVVAYRRGDTLVAANCGDRPHRTALPEGTWEAVFATDRRGEGRTVDTELALGPHEAMVLVPREPGSRGG
ncbi:MAG TPA: alpha-amylase family glycosyl hydrolase [Egibacteraceae bacterium]|nr:alpha-amylase family glycosyl hydrolase [Egibacteraceae bacterium]